MTLPRAIQEAIRLPDGAIPQSCQATHDPEAIDRRTDCRRVSQCVSLAVERQWPALSCGMCPIVDPMDRDELRQEMHAIADLLREARVWESVTRLEDAQGNRHFQEAREVRAMKRRLVVAVAPAVKIEISRPVSKETALAVFEILPSTGRPERSGEIPDTRAGCAGGARPCPWIECLYHLALDTTADRWGTPVASLAERFEWDKPSCALDVAESGPKSVREVAGLTGLPERVVKRVTKRAVKKLESLGLAAFAVSLSPRR